MTSSWFSQAARGPGRPLAVWPRFMLPQQLVSRVAKQQVFQHLDHGLSPARWGDEQALKKSIAFLKRELLAEVIQLFQAGRHGHPVFTASEGCSSAPWRS